MEYTILMVYIKHDHFIDKWNVILAIFYVLYSEF